MDYLAAARRTNTRAMLFFIPNSGSQQPPAVSDSVWDVDDGGQWKSDNDFPVYAVSGDTGAELMEQMVAYMGDVDDVPFGDDVRQEFGPGFVKLYAQFETGMNIYRPLAIPCTYSSALLIFQHHLKQNGSNIIYYSRFYCEDARAMGLCTHSTRCCWAYCCWHIRLHAFCAIQTEVPASAENCYW